ncbi:RNA polymerase sigma factor SigF [Gloeocapsa sp. PCC 73106]|uniref:RNA polymerase sigma factor SigF n=1 Tax=Gloeocapsa sp. PCC 73106 TaxID=102232 RepID=UPI0002AC5E66|nr:RNA polymerase sigma factor SigF [Gloeocapsa sp. PCC 73106]ELR96900.1 RNA polymerase sigma factor, sigma-70 family [Gloeocapsa sp. PCC 73106]
MSTSITQQVNNNLKLECLRLFQDYRISGNPDLRNKIMQLNFGLVKKEVYNWINQYHESYEDLLQVGCLGLLRAIERFDPEKGHAFSSYAIPYIRGEIQHYLRDKNHSVKIPRRWLELGQQAATATKNFQKKFNRLPQDSEIAQILEISVQEWREIKLAYQNREPLSLDLPVGDNEENKTCLGDLVPDSEYRSFQLAQEDKIRLQNALNNLEEKTRNVLEFVFLYDLTQKETAERLGISVITVSRHLKKGVNLMKNFMGQE